MPLGGETKTVPGNIFVMYHFSFAPWQSAQIDFGISLSFFFFEFPVGEEEKFSSHKALAYGRWQ